MRKSDITKSGMPLKNFVVRVPAHVVRSFKARAVQEDVMLQDAVTEALATWRQQKSHSLKRVNSR